MLLVSWILGFIQNDNTEQNDLIKCYGIHGIPSSWSQCCVSVFLKLFRSNPSKLLVKFEYGGEE